MEIDAVIGLKVKTDSVFLTITELKTRNSIIRLIPAKIAGAVNKELNKIMYYFVSKFSRIFRTITGDNGLEFAELSALEKDTNTKIYFAHQKTYVINLQERFLAKKLQNNSSKRGGYHLFVLTNLVLTENQFNLLLQFRKYKLL